MLHARMSVDFVVQGVSVVRSSTGELDEAVRLLNSLSFTAAATHAAELVQTMSLAAG